MITLVTDVISEISPISAKCGGNISGDLGGYIPIVDHLMKNRFQLYNRSRQNITGDIFQGYPVKVFQLYEDELQISDDSEAITKKFVATSIQYKPESGISKVTLMEYDNTVSVNLIDVTITDDGN
jgi:hypothetical protein